MNSKNLLSQKGKLGLNLDSFTFQKRIQDGDRLALAILEHSKSKLLEVVHSPKFSTMPLPLELSRIPEYSLIHEEKEIKEIVIAKPESKSKTNIAFGHNKSKIASVSKIIWKRDATDEEMEQVIPIFVHASINLFDGNGIYVTDNPKILKNRLWLESQFYRTNLNIMTPEEAGYFLDLFFKYNGEYKITGNLVFNKGLLYWTSTRVKLPRFHVGSTFISALAKRFDYALRTLDEIGKQYYLGTNNDTMDETLYYFDYLISLMTGIFDNLALETEAKFNINYQPQIRISLSNKNGKDFLEKVEATNPSIRDHIRNNDCFIRLIYSFREKVLHREGTPHMSFENWDRNAKWSANLIKISKEQLNEINQCGDANLSYDSFTKWGVYQLHKKIFITPYYFSMQCLESLIKFIDRYLELLGHPLFRPTTKVTGNSLNNLDLFEKYHLGM